jgi:two-component system, NarL family, response regulator LiaR
VADSERLHRIDGWRNGFNCAVDLPVPDLEEETDTVMTIRLMLADDHAVVRQGLRLFLEADEEIHVLAEEASTGEEAVEIARRTRPDVILMDLLMPGMDGFLATRTIHQEMPETNVVVLTSLLDSQASSAVVDAVRAGAVGYLLKSSNADELRQAVHAAAAGHVQLSPEAARRLVSEVASPTASKLTARETEVLVMLGRGKANKEIARELGIGQQTVKTFVSSILVKLGVQSRTQAALHAVRMGLISDTEREE